MKSYKLQKNPWILKKSIKPKCSSCGAVLSEDINSPGYTPVLNKSTMCKRCFQIKYYGKTSSNKAFHQSYSQEILSNFDYSKNAIFYVCDLTTVPFCIEEIQRIKQKAKLFYILISKIDLIITTKNFELVKKRIFNFLEKCGINFDKEKIIICSASNKINFSEINELIKSLVKSNNKVCFAGYTNAGKSSIINWLIQKNKINHEPLIVSHNLNTTQGIKQIKNKEFVLIDLPGKIDDSNFQSLMSLDQLKSNLSINKTKPKIYQLKNDKIFVFENLLVIKLKNNLNNAKVVFYLSPNLKIHKSNLNNFQNISDKFSNIFPNIQVPNFTDWKEYNFSSLKNGCLVLYGLGIINFYNVSNINLMVPKTIRAPFFIENFKL